MNYIDLIVLVINYIRHLCNYPVTSDYLLGCLRTWLPAARAFLVTRGCIFFAWKSSTWNLENTLVLSGEIQPKPKSHFSPVWQRFGCWVLTLGSEIPQAGKGGVSLRLLFCVGKEGSRGARSRACVRTERWCWGNWNCVVWLKETLSVAPRGKRPFF